MPGATVRVKGTTNGTVTDLDGKFSLDVADGAVLQISYLGYLLQEIPVNGQSVITVQLEPDATQLDELVVVGYGTQRKADLVN